MTTENVEEIKSLFWDNLKKDGTTIAPDPTPTPTPTLEEDEEDDEEDEEDDEEDEEDDEEEDEEDEEDDEEDEEDDVDLYTTENILGYTDPEDRMDELADEAYWNSLINN
jgi:hypothetical protein